MSAANQPLCSYLGTSVRYPLGGWRNMYLLKIFEYKLEIGPAWSGLRFFLPYWRVPLQELTVAEAVTRRRIRFRTKGDFRVFDALAWRRDDVLALLDQLGVPIDPEPQPFSVLFPWE